MAGIIFHIDVNSAYLSWSAIKRLSTGDPLDLRTVPAIVGGDMQKRHGVVLAKSVPAKKYGIVTGEPIVNAFRKCPSLILEAPDPALYHRQSSLLMHFLSDICPDIEQLSIDECFMDFTPIRERYFSPEAAAKAIKDEIRERFGFTVNIGISDRKVLAKMASDFQKPDKVHTLYSHEIREKLWPLPTFEVTVLDLHTDHPCKLSGFAKSCGNAFTQRKKAGKCVLSVCNILCQGGGVPNALRLCGHRYNRRVIDPVGIAEEQKTMAF